jgi:quercetin dioxygenase-like cupin family protein
MMELMEKLDSITESTRPPSHEQLTEFERLIKQDLGEVELPVTHHFSEGVYARELFIPKGTVLTGKIHKFTNLNILIEGELSVSTDTGIKRVKAPFLVVSPPGTKRVAYAHEDSRWLTVHGTTETDLDVIEQAFVAQDEQEYLAFCDSQKLLKGEK